ncbi:hypothetical protein [Synechococcus sp. MIT S9509]|nr:hypothetical protein [Synechococcus sp. MIT S9509]
MSQFLLPNIHFKAKTPNSPQLVWDLTATVNAWEAARQIALQQSEGA